MTRYIAISNRRGGVGKTTTTMMLAYGLAVFGFQRVLVIDLDAQASTSIVLLGPDRWQLACDHDHDLSNLLIEMFGDGEIDVSPYIQNYVGDVHMVPGNRRPTIDCIATSFQLDDREQEMLFLLQNSAPTLERVYANLRARVARIIRSVPQDYDYVLLDCPPGLSQIAWGALTAADYVLIPYIPDPTAEYNVRALSERIASIDPDKPIRTLPTQVRGQGAFQRGVVERISRNFPSIGIEIPRRAHISYALEYRAQPVPIRMKFGDGAQDVERLFRATIEWTAPGRVAV